MSKKSCLIEDPVQELSLGPVFPEMDGLAPNTKGRGWGRSTAVGHLQSMSKATKEANEEGCRAGLELAKCTLGHGRQLLA